MIDFVKDEKVRLSALGIHTLIKNRTRILKATSIGVVGRPSYCGGCVYVKFPGMQSFSDFAAEFIESASDAKPDKAAWPFEHEVIPRQVERQELIDRQYAHLPPKVVW